MLRIRLPPQEGLNRAFWTRPQFSQLRSSDSLPEAGQHLAFGKVFKPVGWVKPSLARSGSTSKGGKTGKNRLRVSFQKPKISIRLRCTRHRRDEHLDSRCLRAHFLSGPSYGFFAHFASFLPHSTELCERRELRYWPRKVFVERVAALLLNLASLRWSLITMTLIESRFFHGFTSQEQG